MVISYFVPMPYGRPLRERGIHGQKCLGRADGQYRADRRHEHAGEPLVLHEPAAPSIKPVHFEAVFGVEDTANAEMAMPGQRFAGIELDDLRSECLRLAVREREDQRDCTAEGECPVERSDERVPLPEPLRCRQHVPHGSSRCIDVADDADLDGQRSGLHRGRRLAVVLRRRCAHSPPNAEIDRDTHDAVAGFDG